MGEIEIEMYRPRVMSAQMAQRTGDAFTPMPADGCRAPTGTLLLTTQEGEEGPVEQVLSVACIGEAGCVRYVEITRSRRGDPRLAKMAEELQNSNAMRRLEAALNRITNSYTRGAHAQATSTEREHARRIQKSANERWQREERIEQAAYRARSEAADRPPNEQERAAADAARKAAAAIPGEPQEDKHDEKLHRQLQELDDKVADAIAVCATAASTEGRLDPGPDLIDGMTAHWAVLARQMVTREEELEELADRQDRCRLAIDGSTK